MGESYHSPAKHLLDSYHDALADETLEYYNQEEIVGVLFGKIYQFHCLRNEIDNITEDCVKHNNSPMTVHGQFQSIVKKTSSTASPCMVRQIIGQPRRR